LFLSVLSLETTESNAFKNLTYLEAPVTVRPRSDDLSPLLLHLVLYLLVLEEFFLVAPFLIAEEGDRFPGSASHREYALRTSSSRAGRGAGGSVTHSLRLSRPEGVIL
jgi:hypothetical protein